MQSKHAQGISINTIVIVLIALLTLALILAFATGSFSRLTSKLKQSESATGQTEIIAIQAQCSQACLQAKNIALDTQWPDTNYCTKTITLDDEELNCWDPPINKICEVTVKNANEEDMVCTPPCGDCEKV